MRTFAAKPAAKSTAKPKLVKKKRPAPPRVNHFSLLSTGMPLLQGKTGCACGGVCPRCQAEPALQTKLKISEPGDKFEQEADRIAEQVMRIPEPVLQRQMDEEEKELLQTKPFVQGRLNREDVRMQAEFPPTVYQSLRSPGQPLNSDTCAFMEQRFGHDFSQIRVHTAPEAAAAINAKAFTLGRNVVFGAGNYRPDTSEGRKLLAHELVHTIQQKAARTQQIPKVMRFPLNGPSLFAESSSLTSSPILQPTVIRADLGIIARVYFARNRFVLDSANYAVLEKLSEELAFIAAPTVVVDGHTSTEGTEEFNLELSENRRQAVIAILASKATRAIEFSGTAFGESQPSVEEAGASSPELEDQRAHNRRVDILVLSPAVEPTESTEPTKPTDPTKRIDLIPSDLIEKHAQKIPENKPKCSCENGSAVSRDNFENLPAELRAVLSAKLFNRLNSQKRFALTEIYNRLCKFNLWCHVKSVKEVKDGEPPFFGFFQVPGVSISVSFDSYDSTAFYNAIINSFTICQDSRIGGLFHSGQSSTRQISISDSMHISVGPGDSFDVHLDRFSSPSGLKGSHCIYDPQGTAAHLGRELFPEHFRKFTGIGGVELFPEPAAPTPPVPEGALGREEDVPSNIIGITLRGLIPGNTPRRLPPPEFVMTPEGPRERQEKSPIECGSPLEEEGLIRDAIREQVSSNALIPSDLLRRLERAVKLKEFAGPEEEELRGLAIRDIQKSLEVYRNIEVEEVAICLARKLNEAYEERRTKIKFDLGSPYQDVSNPNTIFSELKRIILIVRRRLPHRAAGVTRADIHFGREQLVRPIVW